MLKPGYLEKNKVHRFFQLKNHDQSFYITDIKTKLFTVLEMELSLEECIWTTKAKKQTQCYTIPYFVPVSS